MNQSKEIQDAHIELERLVILWKKLEEKVYDVGTNKSVDAIHRDEEINKYFEVINERVSVHMHLMTICYTLELLDGAFNTEQYLKSRGVVDDLKAQPFTINMVTKPLNFIELSLTV